MWIISTLAVLAVIFFTFQAFQMSSNRQIEQHAYTVVKQIGEVEIRAYEAADFSQVTLPVDSYKDGANRGFRTLAGYIFGGNAEGQKIAMTAPVAMDMSDSMRMRFMIPSAYETEELPAPNDDRITFVHAPAKKVAALRFGGWANDERIASFSAILKTTLDEAGIAYHDQVTFLGYDPPYAVVGRRNEVTVTLK